MSPESRPRVIWVWVGGYLAAPAYVGLGDRLAESEKPDLILASCGSSIAAAVWALLPDPAERMRFLTSGEYRNLLAQFAPHNSRLTGIAAKIGEIVRDWGRRGTRRHYPDIYRDTLLNLPDRMNAPSLDRPFAQARPPLVVVGSRVFGPEMVGRRVDGAPWVREVFFTDEATAQRVKGFETPLAKIPGSRVPKEVEVVADRTVLDAVRAAVTDIYMINPTSDGYAGGMANLFPYDLARHLGGPGAKVLGTYRGDFNPLSEPVMNLMLGYSLPAVSRPASQRSDVRFVDFSDFQQWNKEYGFRLRLKRTLGSGLAQLQKAVDESSDPASFVRQVEALYRIGRERGEDFIRHGGSPPIGNPMSLAPNLGEILLRAGWKTASLVASAFPRGRG